MNAVRAALPEAMRLDGRVAVVTGAGRGLGRGIALALARAGADVALLSRTPADLAEVAAEVSAIGRRAWELPCDVADVASLRVALAQVERIDVLVASAGINVPEPLLDVEPETYRRIFAVNVEGTYFAAQEAARRMVAQGDGGAIVLTSSQMGHVGAAGRTVYCASKHAVEGLVKAMGVELAPHRVRVNAVAPTYVRTPMTAALLEDPAFAARLAAAIPLGVGEVDDVVGAVVFLASPAARLVTGTSLLNDGGYTAQ